MEPVSDRRVQLPGYEKVAATATRLLDAAGGGALCVYHDGSPALDLWTGVKDPATAAPWEQDTMAMSWSTTKGIASTALHLLADRGQLGYDDRVSRYWPEFAVNGKEEATIRHVLSMEAGLYDIRHLIADPGMMLDNEAMVAALAAATPAHRPGVANGYHALTYGWLIGELVARVGGVSLGTFVRTEIAEPLGLDGCFVGTPDDQLHRVAAFPDLPPEKPIMRLIGRALDPITSIFGLSPRRIAAAFLPHGANEVIPTAAFLRAEVPSANGVFTARSLARLYAALGSDSGVDGVRLWTPETRRAVSEQQNSRRDLVLPIKVKWRLGYHRPLPRRKASRSAFGFYGAFGSGAFADPDRRLAVGLVLQQSRSVPLNRLVGPILEAAERG